MSVPARVSIESSASEPISIRTPRASANAARLECACAVTPLAGLWGS